MDGPWWKGMIRTMRNLLGFLPSCKLCSCWACGSVAFAHLLILRVLYKCPLQQPDFLLSWATTQGFHWDCSLMKDFLLKWQMMGQHLASYFPPQTIYMLTAFLYPWILLVSSIPYKPAPWLSWTTFQPWAIPGSRLGLFSLIFSGFMALLFSLILRWL